MNLREPGGTEALVNRAWNGPMTVLNDAPVGQTLRIVHIDGGKALHRRLRSLGLTPGTEVKVLQHRGRGVVVANGGNRVALGGGIADKLRCEVID